MRPEATLIAYTQINPKINHAKFPLHDPLDLIEFAGRWDYGRKSVEKMGDRGIIGRWIASGEESMVEMVSANFFIECSRVVSHEIVRHRLASYQQESQRYVNYSEEDPEDLLYTDPQIVGPEFAESTDILDIFDLTTYHALKAYNELLEKGVKKQIARYVLPNATRTRIIMAANLREWRHIIKLRMHKSAQPEMQIIATQMHDQLLETFPEAFIDIKPSLEAGERASR